MAVTGLVPQLRTTDMASSIRFYTEKLGFSVEFNYQGFYAGLRAGNQVVHLKLVDDKDPSLTWVDEGGHFHLYLNTTGVADFADQLKARGVPLVKDVHETPWNTREIVIHDDQGHTVYLGEPLNHLSSSVATPSRDVSVAEPRMTEQRTEGETGWYTRPVLFVADLDRAIRFYVDTLGFRKKWHEGDGAGTVCQVNRGGCEIILCEDAKRRDKARLFVELNGDELARCRREIIERGVPFRETWWGYPSIQIDDPDGNELLLPIEGNNVAPPHHREDA